MKRISYVDFESEVIKMSNQKMSDALKSEIARELGVYDTVKRDGGWGNVSSRDCGNMVAKAIEIAERAMNQK